MFRIDARRESAASLGSATRREDISLTLSDMGSVERPHCTVIPGTTLFGTGWRRVGGSEMCPQPENDPQILALVPSPLDRGLSRSADSTGRPVAPATRRSRRVALVDQR
jgi:hypothetical protein